MPKRVAVLFHGNGGEAINRSWLNDLIPEKDVVLVLAEHPGYGARAGKPTESALVGAGRGIISEINRRWHRPITVIGESLGSGVACAVAGDSGVDRLALISPFYSALDVATRKLPILPMGLLMKDTYRSDLALRSVKVPLYIVHGTDDDVVPFASGKALFDSYGGGPRWMTPAPGRKHNDMLNFLLKDGAAEQFRAFLVGLLPSEG